VNDDEQALTVRLGLDYLREIKIPHHSHHPPPFKRIILLLAAKGYKPV
jgi:hypothetical protein